MNLDDPAERDPLAEDEEDEESASETVDVLPLATDADTPIPALREVRAQIVRLSEDGPVPATEVDTDNDKTVVILEDPEGLAPKPAVLTMWAYMLASLFDGHRSARTIADVFNQKFGQPVPVEETLDLQRELDKALYLFSKRFAKTVRREIRGYLDHDIRPAVHAGVAYPADAEQLQQSVMGFFIAPDGPGACPVEPRGDAAASEKSPSGGEAARDTVRALVLPHIDLRVGGATYAHGYAELLKHSRADLFVILGVAHQAPDGGAYYVSQKDYATPVGVVKTERAMARRLQAAGSTEPVLAELAHRTEHSIEFQAVLLATLLERCGREFQIVPVLCGPAEAFMAKDAKPMDAEPVRKFTDALRAELEACKRKWCVICSVDMSHVGPEFGHSTMMTERLLPPVARYDKKLLKTLERLDAAAFYAEILRTENSRHVDAVLANPPPQLLHGAGGFLDRRVVGCDADVGRRVPAFQDALAQARLRDSELQLELLEFGGADAHPREAFGGLARGFEAA
ncbi:MAG: AmmeMemoRadiSam system protein B [Planctomycetota bacterium]|nr:AmmeMemoRadiSam system protein B [Planctomycetota bacterium]